ncbi:MAG: hypothetical protein KDD40_05460 [Bdellovibrionales bacterium]|nr:hypothetical protein [Bdellovibrionales bacterium]
MEFEFKAASKTFLIGEYAVLKGGPAIVLNTSPTFSLKVTKSKENDCMGIHPLSPAGKWLRSRALYFNGLKIKFNDPWQGKGGLGASSAQFLFVHALAQVLQQQIPFLNSKDYLLQLLNDFKSLYTDSKGVVPSGVDLLAQYLGGVSLVNKNRELSYATNWPFVLKNFLIFKTSKKVKSHEHLLTLEHESFKELIELAQKSVFLFEKGEWSAFVLCLQQYQQHLAIKKWTCESTPLKLN